jgi:hypothetical protein
MQDLFDKLLTCNKNDKRKNESLDKVFVNDFRIESIYIWPSLLVSPCDKLLV